MVRIIESFKQIKALLGKIGHKMSCSRLNRKALKDWPSGLMSSWLGQLHKKKNSRQSIQILF